MRQTKDSGQVTIFVMLAMGIFLLRLIGFAVDMTNMWFHRQTAQGAADAACQAGIMDVLVNAEGTPTPGSGFTAGTAFDCASSSTPSPSPCIYAALNGYNGAGLVADTQSNDVAISFPGTVTNPPPTSAAGVAPVPYLQADVTDRVPLTFASLLTNTRTSDVRARATCGIVYAKVPIPMIVLNPVCAHSLDVQGSAEIKIAGGPPKSIQVNSNSTYPSPSLPPICAAATTGSTGSCTANAVIDLSQGGVAGTGSMFGTFGGPATAPPNFMPGTTGSWQQQSPISDPFATLPAPARPTTPGTLTLVPSGTNGCPDSNGCVEFTPGLYTTAIVVKKGAIRANGSLVGMANCLGGKPCATAIFDPGLYYIAPTAAAGSFDSEGCGSPSCANATNPGGSCNYDFAVNSNGIVRPSKLAVDPSGMGGTVFYFTKDPAATNYGSVFFGSSAGSAPGSYTIQPYTPTGDAYSPNLVCPGGSSPTPASMNGNVLLAPCSGPYGDPLGTRRVMLFFQDRANNDNHGQPSLQGGGGFIMAGTMYFHNCPNSPNCAPYPTDWNAYLQLQGGACSATQVMGQIVTDQLGIAGSGCVNMTLDPFLKRNILKATLLQ